MKILILRFSSIGDIVLTSPVMRCLKTQLPDSEIHFATKEKFKSLVEFNPCVHKVHLLNDSTTQLIESLKTEQFDVVIDLHHNIRTWRIIRALQVSKVYKFNKLNFKKWLLVNLKWNTMPRVHIVTRYLEACKQLGVQYDGNGLDFFMPANFTLSDQVSQALPQGEFLTFAVGGTHATKRLPEKRIAELLEKILVPVVLLGDSSDAARMKIVENSFSGQILNLCGKTSLFESAEIVNRSKALICHDTGLMHIAAAMQKPIVSIWGNTVPEFGMTPFYNDRNKSIGTVFQVENLACRPCSKIGFSACPKGHFNCMNMQSLPFIAEKANNI